MKMILKKDIPSKTPPTPPNTRGRFPPQSRGIKGEFSGFTLIELLLSVTLSAVLMTGIVVFVSSSLGSNMATKKTLEERNENGSFEQHLTETLGTITGSGVYTTGASFGGRYLTGIFLSTGGSNLPITFLGLRTQTGYCDSYSGTASETGTVLQLVLRQFSTPIVQNIPSYTLSSTGNAVFSGTNRIIGTGYPGNTLTASGIDTELSSPSALVLSGNRLYIADTMNDRVLSYDITSGNITKLLGAENGLRKPTSLYFSGNTLLIASSGNGRIYSLQDGDDWTGTTFSSTFKVANSFTANKIVFTFTGSSSVTAPSSSGSFTFSGFNKNTVDTVIVNGNTITYSGILQSFSTDSSYKVTINSIAGNTINLGNNLVQIDFRNGSALQYSDTFHYFTKWDGSLENNTGNIVKILSWGLLYPHSITGANTWQTTIDWNTVLSQNPPGNETFSHIPVRDMDFSLTGKVLTIKYHEYTNYDCVLWKHQIIEKIKKILLP